MSVERNETQASGAKFKWLAAALAGAVVLGGGGFLAWQQLAGQPPELAGVWRNQASGEVYVLEKKDEDYRMTVAGRRLPVTAVESSGDQVLLTVRTESGLSAIWSFRAQEAAEGERQLRLDRDGFFVEDLSFQRELTEMDRQRLARLKPAKKPLWSPGFDCGKAASDAERLLCSDRSLASLDVQLGQDFRALDGTQEQREAQQSWLREVRDACSDANCLREAYQSRSDELQAERAPEEYTDDEENPELAAPAADAAPAAPAVEAAAL